MIIQDRPYQAQMKAETYAHWQSGTQNVLNVLPTGGGKSVIVSGIAYDINNAGMPHCVIAHRNELVSQMSMHIADRGIPHRLLAPDDVVKQITRKHREKYEGRSFINPGAICSIGGVDTIWARREKLGKRWFEQQRHWTIDEAHHVIKKNKWGKVVELFPNAFGLGVTATPTSADGRGLGRHHDGVFDTMVQGPSMRQLIDMGSLCEYEIACPESDIIMHEEDIGESGDYSKTKLKKAAQKSRIVGDVVQQYARFALFKQAIVFATDIETAGKIAENFNANHISAAALSSETPGEVRDKYVTEFRQGKLKILVNVDLFGEGFDCPACEVVIMARPTASLGLYLQMAGRALRTAPGKLYGLIIDHVGNVKRHGYPDKIHHWTLDRRDKRAKKEKHPDEVILTSCRACTKPFEAFYPACPYCGWEVPLPEPRERSIQMVEGNLFLLDREMLAAMRAKTQLAAPGDVASRASMAAGPIAAAAAATRQIEKIGAQEELKHEIAQWAAIQREKGRSDPEIHKRFYHAAGGDVLSVLAADNSASDYRKMSGKIREWYQ